MDQYRSGSQQLRVVGSSRPALRSAGKRGGPLASSEEPPGGKPFPEKPSLSVTPWSWSVTAPVGPGPLRPVLLPRDECSGLNEAPQRCVYPEPVNGTPFGKRVVADVVNLRILT